MDDESRRRLGEERRLIFENIANGVPIESVCHAFHKSRMEIQQAVFFVARKLVEYRFRRCKEAPKGATVGSRWDVPGGGPPISIQSYQDIRTNRLALLDTLRRCGPIFLSTDLTLPKIYIENMDSKDAVMAASHRLRAHG